MSSLRIFENLNHINPLINRVNYNQILMLCKKKFKIVIIFSIPGKGF